MAPNQPKMSQEQQKLMMRKDALHKGFWYYNYEKNSLANPKEEAKEYAKNNPPSYEQPPKTTNAFS